MTRIFPLISFVLAVLWCTNLQASSISGEVSWKVEDPPPPNAIGTWSERSPFVAEPEAENPGSAVLVLEHNGEPLPALQDSVIIVIDDLKFTNRTLAARAGAALELVNRTIYRLNIDLEDADHTLASVTLDPKGGTDKLTVEQTGVYRLQAREFTHLRADVVVLNRGQYAPIDNASGFQFENLEGGSYKMKIWSGRWAEGKSFLLEPDELIKVDVRVSAKQDRVIALDTVKTSSSKTSAVVPSQPIISAPVVAPPQPAKRVPKARVVTPPSRASQPPAAGTGKPAAKRVKPAPQKKKPSTKKSAPPKSPDDTEGDDLFKIKVLD